MTAKAVVVGLYGANPLGIVRSLGIEEIPVIGVHYENKYPHAKYSKYLENHHIVEGEEAAIQKLVDIGKTFDEKSVLFATGDTRVLLLEDNKEILSEFYHVPLVSKRNIRDIIDKHAVLSVGKEAGFLVPRSTYLSDLLNNSTEISFPILLKPLNSTIGTKDDMVLVQTKDELNKKIKTLNKDVSKIIAEEYIKGPITNHFEVHTYLSSEGPLIGGMLQRLKEYHVGKDAKEGFMNKSTWIDALVHPSLKLTESLKFNGAIDINLIRDEDSGQFYFIEANLRTSSNLILDTMAGLNLPAIIYHDLTGNNFSKYVHTDYRKDVFWMYDHRILSELEHGNITLEEIAPYFMQDHVCAFYDKNDSIPYIESLRKGKLLPKR